MTIMASTIVNSGHGAIIDMEPVTPPVARVVRLDQSLGGRWSVTFEDGFRAELFGILIRVTAAPIMAVAA